jgi:hypothetical protein
MATTFRGLRAYCITLVLGLVVLAACGQPPPTTHPPVAATRTVVDMTGRSVQIPVDVTRSPRTTRRWTRRCSCWVPPIGSWRPAGAWALSSRRWTHH